MKFLYIRSSWTLWSSIFQYVTFDLQHKHLLKICWWLGLDLCTSYKWNWSALLKKKELKIEEYNSTVRGYFIVRFTNSRICIMKTLCFGNGCLQYKKYELWRTETPWQLNNRIRWRWLDLAHTSLDPETRKFRVSFWEDGLISKGREEAWYCALLHSERSWKLQLIVWKL